MTIEVDIAVRELAHLKIALREDLTFGFQCYDDAECYVVEDTLRSRFFRIGIPEYRFVSLFDGTRTLSEVIGIAARQLGSEAFTEHDAITVVDWLLDNELATTDQPMRSDRLLNSLERSSNKKALSRLNLIFQKVPLCNPDRFITAASRWSGFLVSPWFFLIWIAIVITGLWQVIAGWDQFLHADSGVFSANNWIYLILIWTLLKVIHEFFHGLVCRRYGGEVLEAGVILILFMPIGYVDATSSWRFPSKWMRIHTAAAGMYIEFFLAACAAWVWALSNDAVVTQLAQNVVLVASINTLLFNANPLMKFDGYYIFSDFLEIPNLYTEGQQSVKRHCKRWLFGVKYDSSSETRRHRTITGWYGWLSLIWRVSVVATLLIVAHTLFYGAGVALAILSGLMIIGLPLWNLCKYIVLGSNNDKPARLRFAVSVVLIAVIGVGFFRGLVLTPQIDIPAVVDYREVTELRAGIDGFVDQILVTPGQNVVTGQILAVMRNDPVESELHDMKLRQLEIQQRIRTAMANGKTAMVQAEREQAASMQINIDEFEKLTAQLTLRAPHNGEVIARRLPTLTGKWLDRGDDFFTIADTKSSELKLSIAQENVDAVRAHLGNNVQAYILGTGDFRATLDTVHPKATQGIVNEAMTSLGGGSIAVQSIQDSTGYEYTEPRFTAIASVNASDTTALKAGLQAWVSIEGQQQSVGRYVYSAVNRWVEQTVAIAKSGLLANPS